VSGFERKWAHSPRVAQCWFRSIAWEKNEEKNKRIDHGERAMPSLSGQVSVIGGQEAQLTGPGSRSSAPEAHTSFPLSATHSTPSAILHYPARFSGIP
jgi:hypothetical protein